MQPTRKQIEIRPGEPCMLRVSLGIKEVAEAHGIDLVAALKDGRTITAFTKIIYCAAINDWEISCVDDPSKGDFPWNFSDFADWGYRNQEEFAGAVRFVLTALGSTGDAGKDKGGMDVKKKT